MTRWLILIVAFALPHAARAADPGDKPILAPPGTWVIPTTLPADSAKPDDAAIRLVLSDQQVRLTPAGQDVYVENLVRVQTPQGLQALGNITLPWKPDTSTLTVHKLRILRGGQVIDLLANGSPFTVLRRENKLEYATLDGVLTAVVQPEGLQVGDLVDIATTTASRDPVLAGHPEGSLAGWANLPISHVRSRAVWDSTLPIRWRATDDTPPVKESRKGGTTEISLTADNLAPILFPKDAPARFRQPRLVEATSFASWADVSALFAPLYAKAEALKPGGPLAGEVARIAAGTADPVKRAEAALALAQDQVRYVFLGLNDGGLMPAAADLTWQRRFGDCKGKTVLLIAMLHALGIDAEAAIVSTQYGDGLDRRLPMVGLFDHILVRATIAGRVFWLDGTRMGDRRLADVVVPPFRWALPVRTSGATLQPLVQVPAARPFTTLDLRIDATAGLSQPAPMHGEAVLRGDIATATRLGIANMAPEQRDRALQEFWTKRYDFLTVKTATASYDDATGEERLVMDGTAAMDWSSNSYEADGMGVGWTADFTRPPGPHQDAPFAVNFPAAERSSETILLPNKGAGFSIDTPDVDRTVAGIHYLRKARLKGGTYTVEMSAQTIEPEFPYVEAAAAQTALRALVKQRVFLNKGKGYAWTDKERATILQSSPKTARDYQDRAAAHLQKAEWQAAIADYSRALELDPKEATALAWRGTAHGRLDQLDAAKQDYARALALDSRQVEAILGQARVAMVERRWPDARAASQTALEIDPKNGEALALRGLADSHLGDPARTAADRAELVRDAPPLLAAQAAEMANDHAGAVTAATAALAAEPGNAPALEVRARANQRLQHLPEALTDIQAALAIDRKNVDAYLLEANILKGMGRGDDVIAVAGRMTQAAPESDHAHVAAAAIYERMHRPADAAREFDAALAIKPTVYAYLTRMQYRAKSDFAGRAVDVGAATKLEPQNPLVIAAATSLAFDRGDFNVAHDRAEAGLHLAPQNTNLRLYHALSGEKIGRPAAEADADFQEARRIEAANPVSLNEMCWEKATRNVALASALEDCDASLKLDGKEPATLDSRGFVLLRLGRYADAIASYDAAVTLRPNQAASLYGRGLAKLRLGRKGEADSDIAAARKADPDVEKQFAGYGVTA